MTVEVTEVNFSGNELILFALVGEDISVVEVPSADVGEAITVEAGDSIEVEPTDDIDTYRYVSKWV